MLLPRLTKALLVCLLVTVGILGGCDPDVKTTTPPVTGGFTAAWCQQTVAKFKNSQPGAIPQNLTTGDSSKTGAEYDANSYFTVLTHLSMENGYVLDWIYDFNGSGGAPLLYARPAKNPGYKNYDEFSEAANDYTRPENDVSAVWFVMGEDTGLYGNKIKLDGTDESYFEYTVMDLLGQQFYLFWHANYDDNEIICTPEALELVLESIGNSGFGEPVDNGFKKAARKINLTPVIEKTGDTVTVRLVVFSLWGGFSRFSFTMYRNYPHTVIGFESEELLEYQCGVMF